MNKSDSLKAHKHNDLINARYSVLTMPEQLLLLAIIGQSDPWKLTSETPVEITVSAFQDLTDYQGGSAYCELKKAVKRLYNRSVIISNPDPDDPNLHETETRWISSVNYYSGQGRIRLYFAPKIIPYLANLSGNYTSFFVRHVANFKSSYGVRLYELLIQWQSKGSREINIDWLRKTWELENKYPAMKDLKKYVIDPAMSDINEHSNIWIKFGQRKEGRRIVAFQFEFGLKSTPKTKPKRLTKKYIKENAIEGETWEVAKKRLSEKMV